MKSIKYMLMTAALLIAAQTASAALITDVVGSSGNYTTAPYAAKTQHGGILIEDSLNLTNRTHVYNQIPAFLAGKAEYIKTSNDDRQTNPFTVTFKLTVDADVYLIIDHRIGYGTSYSSHTVTPHPAAPDLTTKMHWVITNGFVDQGISISVDEGNNDSIDSFGRLYKKYFAAGSTVTLYEQNDSTNRNMYGVAAIANAPLAKNPVPKDGQGLATIPGDLFPGVLIDTNLSWDAPTNSTIDPNFAVNYRVFMDPNQTKVSTGTGCEYFLNFTTATQYDPSSDLPYTTKYYWKVDTRCTLKGKTDPNIFSGSVWSFKTVAEDKAPVAVAGDNIRTWLAKAQSGIQLEGEVVYPEDDSEIEWTAYKAAFPVTVSPPEVTFADASDPATTVTISAAGEYILRLTATDDDAPSIPPSVSQIKVIVHADACEAAKNTAGYVKSAYDFDGNCVVDMKDLALFAARWLISTSATADIFYAATIGDPEQALMSEYWLNIPNGSDPNLLLNDSRYPDSPTGREFITGMFKFTGRSKDHYGQRIRGYIVAPTTGDYTFYVSSDDSSRLFLSTDTNPANAVMIAYTGYVPLDNWTTNASQTSAVQTLTAGQYYYVEALLIENDGTDYISVGWKKPGDTTIEVVPGTALRWYLLP